MPTFTHQRGQSPPHVSSSAPGRRLAARGVALHAGLGPPRPVGDRELPGTSLGHAGPAFLRSGHDFSRISIDAPKVRTDAMAAPRTERAGQKSAASNPFERARGQVPPPQMPPLAPEPEPVAPPPQVPPPVPAPAPEPEPAAPAKPAPKPGPGATKLTITPETKFAAPDGSGRERTDVGIGEEVTLTGSASGNWTASGGSPLALANNATFHWTAPNRQADVTIKLAAAGEEATVALKVIEPADLITGTRTDVIAIPVGTAGAGMHLIFDYHPKSVSFGNVEAKEVSGDATNITGYYAKHFAKADLHHDSGDTFTRIKENNDDTATDTASIQSIPKPYEKGSFDWVIPNHFKVITEGGDGKKFTEVTQAFRMVDATGKIKITKAGASVERSPDGTTV